MQQARLLAQAAQQAVVIGQVQQLRVVAQKVVGAAGAVVVVEAQPVDGAENIFQVRPPQPQPVEVVDAQVQGAARLAHQQPGEHKIHRVAQVQVATGRRCQAADGGHG